MDLGEYLSIKRQLEADKRLLHRLKEKRNTIIQDTVHGSTKSYPYTEVTFHIEGVSPNRSIEDTEIANLEIGISELERALYEAYNTLQKYLDAIPDPIERRVLQCVYLFGLTEQEIANDMWHDRSWVSKIICKYK